MSRKALQVIGGIVGLALLAVPAAAAAESPVARFNPADQAAARAVVTKAADLGAGWKGSVARTARPATGEECPGYWEPKQRDLVITGVARSAFSTTGAQVTTLVQVYKSARMALLDWQRTVSDPKALRCAQRHVSAESTPEFRFVSMKRIAFPRVGRASFRIRVLADVTPAGGGSPQRILVDSVAFGSGRTGVSFTLIAPYADRAAVDAAEIRLARGLNSRIRV
jgi:hypothetical protein